MPKQEMPMGLALIACDTVIEDKRSAKKSLIGICDRIYAANYPCIHPALTVYASLTSGHGAYTCEVFCQHSDSQTRAFYASGQITFRSPMQVVDIVFRLRNVRFPKSGIYWLQFIAGNMPIMARPLQLGQLSPTSDTDNSA